MRRLANAELGVKGKHSLKEDAVLSSVTFSNTFLRNLLQTVGTKYNKVKWAELGFP